MKPSLAECYALLDLTPGASWSEVQEAYRLMVRVWHPDRHQQDPELAVRAGAKLARINAAYQELRQALERGPGAPAGFQAPPPPPPRPPQPSPAGPRPGAGSVPPRGFVTRQRIRPGFTVVFQDHFLTLAHEANHGCTRIRYLREVRRGHAFGPTSVAYQYDRRFTGWFRLPMEFEEAVRQSLAFRSAPEFEATSQGHLDAARYDCEIGESCWNYTYPDGSTRSVGSYRGDPHRLAPVNPGR